MCIYASETPFKLKIKLCFYVLKIRDSIFKKIIKNEEWELYSKKFDIEWNDIFWNHKDENVFDIDDVFFNYFKIL